MCVLGCNLESWIYLTVGLRFIIGYDFYCILILCYYDNQFFKFLPAEIKIKNNEITIGMKLDMDMVVQILKIGASFFGERNGDFWSLSVSVRLF